MAQDGESGTVTLHAVARRAGVSTATVSRVLKGGASASESTRAKVMASAAELGYSRPGRLRPPMVTRHQTHGLVLADLAGTYGAELFMGYAAAAAELDQHVALFVVRRRHDAARELRALAKRVDALAIGPNTVPDSVAHELSRELPVVLLARPGVAGCDSVRAENLVSAARLTRHVLEHGRSHLVFVGDPDGSPDVAQRYSGFRSAHLDAQVPARRPPLRVPLVEGAGIQVADEILRRRVKVDGLVCADDELALAIIKRLQDNGARLPDDLAVVGWDDVSAARYISPGLTTVRQPIRDLGRLAAEHLQTRILGEQPIGRPKVLPTQLVIRSSCGCPTLSPIIDN
ncbi:MAG: LacI family transcriptional regulator [Actinomycetota bacterium]|nr:LacI family transcriptional regulator [Actinomycetota bacterium]